MGLLRPRVRAILWRQTNSNPRPSPKRKRARAKEKGSLRTLLYASIVRKKDIGRGTAHYTLRASRERSMVMLLPLVIKKLRLDNRSYIWHCRSGYINETRLSRLHHDSYLDSMDFESYRPYESFLAGKIMKTKLEKLVSHKANELLELIHFEVCGLMSTQTRGGYSYFITFPDDKSRFGYVYLKRHK